MRSIYLGVAVIMMIIATGVTHAQTASYYWSGGQTISLTQDPSTAIVQMKEGKLSPNVSRSLSASSGISEMETHELTERMVLEFNNTRSETPGNLIRALGLNPDDVRSISYGFALDDGFNVWLTHELVLQFKTGHDLSDLSPLMSQYGAKYLRTDFETIILDVDEVEQVLPLANAIKESGMVKFAHPDFYAKKTHFNDPLFGQQFQMHNTGQTLDGFPGTVDADCNALEAWGITLGSSSITVAVIDDGVEAHEDLSTPSAGYSPRNNGNGTPISSGAHGQACAGIIAARHNGIGVQGVAPNVDLITVNIFVGGETSQMLANAITWAKDSGADVMSNSWGFGSCTYNLSNLTSAINDAAANGRNGKGCVIAFASGNDYFSCVSYPADLPSVIGVGAFGNDGIKSSYSNAGPTLDISAPSNDINNGFLTGAGVRTIDRMGSSGYSSTNYTSSFGGTSAACPVVAGVAALVLSVDPDLTGDEVENILYSTAKDFGAAGRDNSYGWGAVDAFAAVQAAGGSSGGGGNPTCTSTVSSFPYNESFESGTGWSQASGDDLDWTRQSGSTPSSGTGPGSADDGTFYMYVETSSPNYPSKVARLESPCFDFSGLSTPTFDFSYHMLGNAVGNLSLQVSTDGSSWTTEWSLSGSQGSSWQSASVDLGAYAGEAETRLRFVGTSGNSWQGDLCIDGLSITDGGSSGGGGTCPTIDFSSYTISAYGNGQDAGTFSLWNGGEGVILQNNAWKSIAYSYTVTTNTVIEFDFGSTAQGEIHGIGFDTDANISSNRTFKLHGTQNWGITNYDNYPSNDSWVPYTIPVGQFYTGSFNRLFFVCDDDNGGTSNSYFRNIKIYEGSCGSGTLTLYDANAVTPTYGLEKEFTMEVFPNPAKDQLNVVFGKEGESYPAQLTDLAGRVVQQQELQGGQDQLDLGRLSPGIYFLQIRGPEGILVEKFTKSE